MPDLKSGDIPSSKGWKMHKTPYRRSAMVSSLWLALGFMASCGPSNDGKQAVPFPEGCARFFPGGKPPVLMDEGYAPDTRTLCRRSYAALHSGIAKQPLWVAERLTLAQMKLGASVPYVAAYRPDRDVPTDERAEMSDYRDSGYDRGHMAAAGNMPSTSASSEAFLLSNISPQSAGLNRGSWKHLESSVRRQTRGGTVFVVTGPLFQADRILTTHRNGRLLVPTHFFKAVYAEGRGATVFVATNSNDPQWTTMTVEQFRTVYGIDAFPGMRNEFRSVNGVLDGSLNKVASSTMKAKPAAQPEKGKAMSAEHRSEGS